MFSRFHSRRQAGKLLARRLTEYQGRRDVVVLALPRGGVPVAVEVAAALLAPLDICVVRKLGVPGHEELAMGAIASGGIRVLNDDIVQSLELSQALIEASAEKEQAELERRERCYRVDRAPAEVADRTVILIDDGLATGATMRAAVCAARARGARRVVVAVPVAPIETLWRMEHEADHVVCLSTPQPFHAISASYDNFPQLEDEEVRLLLHQVPSETLAAQ